MSIQETNLQSVADAIRARSGGAGTMAAEDFAARILTISTRPAPAFMVPLHLQTAPGAAIAVSNGSETLTTAADAEGIADLLLPSPGTWTVTAARNGREKSITVEAPEGYVWEGNTPKLPEGYTEVAYIQIASGQGVNTGIYPNVSNSRIVMDLQFESYASSIEVVFSANTSNKQNFYCRRETKTQIRAALGTNSQLISAAVDGERLRVELDAQTGMFSIGDTKITLGQGTNVSMTNPLYLFKSYSSGYAAKSKLYACQIYGGETLVRDFIPCINPAGTAGLFDAVESKFYANAWSGSFVAGPAV